MKRRMLSAGLRSLAVWTLALLHVLWLGAAGASARAAEQVIRYHGLRIVVPAGWPVFRLGPGSHVCVRFDRHALYLGQPGAEQRCPAHAIGRTEAIAVAPLTASGASARSAHGPLLPGEQARVARLTLPSRGLAVTASWGGDPALVRRALGLRSLPSQRAAAGAAGARARTPSARARTASARGPVAHASGVYTGLGFDACSTPSEAQMSAWGSSPYRAIGIYIGGVNMACSQPNLNATWVSDETAAGWGLIPIYVGLEAYGACPCASISGNTSSAAAQGAAAASDAVSQAQVNGLGPGNPIYDDMEGYPHTSANTASVLAFLSGWTTQLHAEGYQSGVYSSTGSGVVDLVAQWGTGYAEPDDIWFARWPGEQGTGDPSLPPGDWANHQRLHQYSGGQYQTYGGVTLNIDGDYVDGATAGASSLIPDGTFVQIAGVQGVYLIAGGAPLYVSDPYMYLNATVDTITQQQFDALPQVPKDGTFVTTTGGQTYRIAGGAPLFVTSWSVYGGVQPSITIDQWDVDNITNPLAHLNPVPANGTFLTTNAGRIYRIAGGSPFRISSWHVFHHPQPSVLVDQWDIDNVTNPAAHLLARPVDGTVVEALPSHWYWSFSGGWRQLASSAPGVVGVDDSGVQAFPGQGTLPMPQCQVPTLHRLTFVQAKRAISSALCSLGKVHRPRRWGRFHKLRVYWQIPGARRAFPEGHRIGIKMQ